LKIDHRTDVHFFAVAVRAKPGIKNIVVFGDSLSDAGNVPLWAVDHSVAPDLLYPSPSYYMGRGSNGPVWIEVVAGAYGYSVAPSLAGGTKFAFAGAESGTGFSDQDSPNFLMQVPMWQNAVPNEEIDPPMPWQLFVVWFGPNDMLRYLVETAMAGQLPTREGIGKTIENTV
jgi:phospholipase/lecithinase/hemolysin